MRITIGSRYGEFNNRGTLVIAAMTTCGKTDFAEMLDGMDISFHQIQIPPLRDTDIVVDSAIDEFEDYLGEVDVIIIPPIPLLLETLEENNILYIYYAQCVEDEFYKNKIDSKLIELDQKNYLKEEREEWLADALISEAWCLILLTEEDESIISTLDKLDILKHFSNIDLPVIDKLCKILQ